jgi:hypothetical protein
MTDRRRTGIIPSMSTDLLLRRKWTFRAHGRQVVFVKQPIEHTSHVLMKAFLWALYLPNYPNLKVEIRVGDRYKPDVVAVSLDPTAAPLFWGEAGQVSVEKMAALVRRYPQTHFAIAKWGMALHHLRSNVEKALAGRRHRAPFDLLVFPTDSAERFIDRDGEIHVGHDDLTWLRLGE